MRHLISITFISFWYYYTSKYRRYINSYKSKREKNCYQLLSNLETFITGSGCKNLLLSEPHRSQESTLVSRHFRGYVMKLYHFLQIEISYKNEYIQFFKRVFKFGTKIITSIAPNTLSDIEILQQLPVDG